MWTANKTDSALPGRAHRALREHTRPLHEALDAAMPLASLTQRDGYVHLLLMNWPCVPIELALEQAGVRDLLPDWELRRRRFDLAGDLAALQITPPAAQPLEVEADTATLLGWSYVLEGSRLGAKLILRTVQSGGTAEILRATRFLMHGRGTDFWGSFRAALTAIDDDPGAIAAACNGACAAFERFIDSGASSRRAQLLAGETI